MNDNEMLGKIWKFVENELEEIPGWKSHGESSYAVGCKAALEKVRDYINNLR